MLIPTAPGPGEESADNPVVGFPDEDFYVSDAVCDDQIRNCMPRVGPRLRNSQKLTAAFGSRAFR